MAARLRLGDVIPFTFSFQDSAARWNAFRGSLLKGIVFQRDILALLSHPAKRIADVKLTNRGYEEWTYGYVDTDKNVVGLKIDWSTMTATFPPGNDALRDQVTNFVLYRPYPQTGLYAAFRRKWFGRLLDRYRGTPPKWCSSACRAARFPSRITWCKRRAGSIREFAGRPGACCCWTSTRSNRWNGRNCSRCVSPEDNAGCSRCCPYAWHTRSASC